jgi:hypothetical protein
VKDYSPKTPPESFAPSRTPGFRAHLQGVSLHDLVMLQHLTRASGVYLVLAGQRSGALHFVQGTLVHAEISEGAASAVGNRAAVEILSWPGGEFVTSTQRIAERASVSLSLDELLGPPEDGAGPRPTATGIRRRLSVPAGESAGEPQRALEGAEPKRAVTLATAATPGTALTTPRLMARTELCGEVQVLVSARGEIVDSRGPGAESLAARVAYVARLAELIGQAMGSGEVHGLRVRGSAGELSVRRRADGHIAAAFGVVDAIEATPSTPKPPSLPPTPGLGTAGSTNLDAGAAVGPSTRRSRSPSS